VDIGNRIREARIAAGMSQEALARRSDMSLNGFADIERGKIKNPHYSTLRKIAGSLGVSVAELLGEESPAPLGEPQSAALRHLRDKEDEMPAAAARIDAAKEAAGPQRPPVAQIIEKLDELPRVLWYIPEAERDEWREDLDAQYPDGYLEEDAGPEFVVEDRATVKVLGGAA
jgi:transcriptional regulator with XRE-family HTH domain